MNQIDINDNKLLIGKNEISFEKNIQEVKVVNDIVIVLLAIDGSLDNVYGINHNGDLLWKIQEPDKKIIGNKRFPYVGLSETNNKVSVVDFYGRRLIIDISNGKIIGKDIVK